MRLALAPSLGLVGLLLASAAQTATLNIDGSGQLNGASDVDVDGVLYNVEFMDGSCISLFDECDSNDDFMFSSSPLAVRSAAVALAEQVFIDGPQGAFDTEPELTQGCNDIQVCYAFIPNFVLERHGNVVIWTEVVINRTFGSNSGDVYFPMPTFDTADFPEYTYAIFTHVPEPGTGLLMATGLVLLFGRRIVSAAR